MPEAAVYAATGRQLRHTGTILHKTRPQTFREVVRLLGAGIARRKIARICKVSPETILAIEARNAESVSAQKERLANMAARIAYGAGELIEDELYNGKVKGSQLVPVYGVAVDKLCALTADTTQTTANLNVQINLPDLYSEFLAVSLAIKQAVAKELPPSPTPTLEAEIVA